MDTFSLQMQLFLNSVLIRTSIHIADSYGGNGLGGSVFIYMTSLLIYTKRDRGEEKQAKWIDGKRICM